jgi:hypothetical protein
VCVCLGGGGISTTNRPQRLSGPISSHLFCQRGGFGRAGLEIKCPLSPERFNHWSTVYRWPGKERPVSGRHNHYGGGVIVRSKATPAVCAYCTPSSNRCTTRLVRRRVRGARTLISPPPQVAERWRPAALGRPLPLERQRSCWLAAVNLKVINFHFVEPDKQSQTILLRTLRRPLPNCCDGVANHLLQAPSPLDGAQSSSKRLALVGPKTSAYHTEHSTHSQQPLERLGALLDFSTGISNKIKESFVASAARARNRNVANRFAAPHNPPSDCLIWLIIHITIIIIIIIIIAII